MLSIRHADKSVRISAFHVMAAPTINAIGHIGDTNMPSGSASSFKCDFNHPISTVSPRRPISWVDSNDVVHETSRDECRSGALLGEP